jgi:hypothetical protein
LIEDDDDCLLGYFRRVVVLAASIIRAVTALMMEAASTSGTSVNFYQTTRRNIPEDSHLHTRRSENLNSHIDWGMFENREMRRIFELKREEVTGE